MPHSDGAALVGLCRGAAAGSELRYVLALCPSLPGPCALRISPLDSASGRRD
jgi:hypothetical protein